MKTGTERCKLHSTTQPRFDHCSPFGSFTADKMRSVNQELTFEYAEKTFQTSQVTFDAAHKWTLGLTDVDGCYTNAALLLSDQCEHIIRCAVYEETGKINSKPARSSPVRSSSRWMTPNRNTAETTASDPGLSREENILRLMAKQGAVTRKDVEQLLGCSSFPANKALAVLVEQGKIVKTGAASGTKYVLLAIGCTYNEAEEAKLCYIRQVWSARAGRWPEYIRRMC